MKDELYKVDTLLITHSHSDHVKPATLDSIRTEFPRITVYANADVAYRYDVDKVVGTKPFDLPKGRHILPFDGIHDVPVTYFIIQENDLNILYATDTSDIEIPDDMKIDYFFLESNYDTRKITEMAKQYKRRGYDPYSSSTLRHMSTQRCKEIYFVYRRSRDSPLIELHKSSRFY